MSVIACFLADPRVDPTARSWAGDDALTWAAEAGHVAVVDLLLQDSRVCAIGDAASAKASLQKQSGPAHDFAEAMMEAVIGGHLAVLQRLVADARMGLLPPKHLSEWCRNDFDGRNTLLSMAVRHGHTETVDWLLAHAAVDPSAHECLALRAAADTAGEIAFPLIKRWEAEAKLRGEECTWRKRQYGFEPRAYTEGERIRLAIAEKLLADPRVDPSADDDAALAEAAYAPNRPMFFRLLADPRVNLANPRRPMAVSAAGGGDVVILHHVLADPRVDASQLNRRDGTALAEAVARDQFQAAKMLLADPRVDPAAQDNLAIRMAGRRASLELLELLLADPRVDASARNNAALTKAVRKRDPSIIQRLLAVPAVSASVASLGEYTLKELVERLREECKMVPAAVEAAARARGVAASS